MEHLPFTSLCFENGIFWWKVLNLSARSCGLQSPNSLQGFVRNHANDISFTFSVNVAISVTS